LRGNVDVDGDAIRWEAMIIDGKARMYFGPFPALLRIPLNLIYPAGRGTWSRISGFLAGEMALLAFTGLISSELSASSLPTRGRNWLGGACLAGFVFGTPLLLVLASPSIYNEAIIWAFGWSMAALFFGLRCRNAEGRNLMVLLVAFSLCASAALLSRVTFGAPLLLMALLLALCLPRANRSRLLAALFVPVGTGLAFYLLLSYARFGSFVGTSFDHFINPVHREFAHQYGIFSLRRVPYSLADYFGLSLPSFQTQVPFLKADRHFFAHPQLYSLWFSETYLPVPWASSWLLAGAILGVICLLRRKCADLFDRGAAIAFALQCLCILSFYNLSERYSLDLYPFLIFCLLVFLRNGGVFLTRTYRVIIGLVLVSITINSLATISWLVDSDQNVRPETRAIWNRFLGRSSPGATSESR
jgi:hypothetical protein